MPLGTCEFAMLRSPFEMRSGGPSWNPVIGLARMILVVYTPPMTFTQRIPVERLRDLDVHEGDTLHVVALLDSSFVVQVSRADERPATSGKAGEWLRTAKGSVRLGATESVDDARMDYYATKYGLRR